MMHWLTEEQKRVIREAHGLGLVSFTGIAKEVDVSTAALSSWLSGKKRIQRLRDWKAIKVVCDRLREQVVDSKIPEGPPIAPPPVYGSKNVQFVIAGMKSWMHKLEKRIAVLEKDKEDSLEEILDEMTGEEKE